MEKRKKRGIEGRAPSDARAVYVTVTVTWVTPLGLMVKSPLKPLPAPDWQPIFPVVSVLATVICAWPPEFVTTNVAWNGGNTTTRHNAPATLPPVLSTTVSRMVGGLAANANWTSAGVRAVTIRSAANAYFAIFLLDLLFAFGYFSHRAPPRRSASTRRDP